MLFLGRDEVGTNLGSFGVLNSHHMEQETKRLLESAQD